MEARYGSSRTVAQCEARAQKNDAPDREQLNIMRWPRDAKTHERRSVVDPSKPIPVAETGAPEKPKGSDETAYSEHTRSVVQAKPDWGGWHNNDSSSVKLASSMTSTYARNIKVHALVIQGTRLRVCRNNIYTPLAT